MAIRAAFCERFVVVGRDLFARCLHAPGACKHSTQQFPVDRQQIHEHRRIIAIVLGDRKHVRILPDQCRPFLPGKFDDQRLAIFPEPHASKKRIGAWLSLT